MESYIRPGCVVLSVYVAMSASAWERVSEFVLVVMCSKHLLVFISFFFVQLEENLLQRVSSLVQDSEFWSNTRFLVNTGRQLASYKHGECS